VYTLTEKPQQLMSICRADLSPIKPASVNSALASVQFYNDDRYRTSINAMQTYTHTHTHTHVVCLIVITILPDRKKKYYR